MNKSLIIISCIVLSSCGSVPQKTYNQLATLIEVVTLDLIVPHLKIRLTNRQKKERLNPQISCQLISDSGVSFILDPMELPDLKPHISETLSSPQVPRLTDSVELPNQSFSYHLECMLVSDNYSVEKITLQSVLHPVPGHHGQYR